LQTTDLKLHLRPAIEGQSRKNEEKKKVHKRKAEKRLSLKQGERREIRRGKELI